MAGDEAGTTARPAPTINTLGEREYRAAAAALNDFETHWRHGGSALLRSMVDTGTIELLGGPLAHPFGPLLDPRLRDFSLREGLADADQRFGSRPTGIWAPECAYAPGMETGYQQGGVDHFMVDGPALHGDTSLGDPSTTATSSPSAATCRCPTGSGPRNPVTRATRRTATSTPTTIISDSNRPGSPAAGSPVATRSRTNPNAPRQCWPGTSPTSWTASGPACSTRIARIGRPALVVAAFDTELFGHWWHEDPQWLEAVLRALPEAGVRVGTLQTAREQGYVGTPAALQKSSWGSGKDWRVARTEVADLVRIIAEVVQRRSPRQQARGPGRLRGTGQRSDSARGPPTASSGLAVHGPQGHCPPNYARQPAVHPCPCDSRDLRRRRSRPRTAGGKPLLRCGAADILFPGLDARRWGTFA